MVRGMIFVIFLQKHRKSIVQAWISCSRHGFHPPGMDFILQAWISSLRHGFQASGMDFKPQAWIQNRPAFLLPSYPYTRATIPSSEQKKKTKIKQKQYDEVANQDLEATDPVASPSSQRPAASSQQPAASRQPPAASGQSP